ncbi:hypothetical protein CEXT_167621 [Caerostris extrusa]|uniref:Uncharacterized protein n=1 Tax=Caerostris extrusa TaxID=172846 RepID=A0AAV4Y6E4_CAEEX|nr:hypothetical protein CEXT_167621 [Caerostris extrusa]
MSSIECENITDLHRGAWCVYHLMQGSQESSFYTVQCRSHHLLGKKCPEKLEYSFVFIMWFRLNVYPDRALTVSALIARDGAIYFRATDIAKLLGYKGGSYFAKSIFIHKIRVADLVLCDR